MPKEQTTQLNQRPAVETQAGVLQKSVSQIVEMPAVVPQKTKGIQLAEAVGIALQGAQAVGTEIVKNNQQKQDTLDQVDFTSYADKLAKQNIEEVEQLPVADRPEAYKQKLELGINNLREQYKNNKISQAGFAAYVQTLSSEYGKYESKALNEISQIEAEDRLNALQTFLSQPENTNYGKLDIQTLSETYGASKADIAKGWYGAQLALLEQRQLAGQISAGDAISSVKGLLNSMATKDNPNIKNNSTLVLMSNSAISGYQAEQRRQAANSLLESLDNKNVISADSNGASPNPQQTLLNLSEVKTKLETRLKQGDLGKSQLKALNKQLTDTNSMILEYTYLEREFDAAMSTNNWAVIKDHLQADRNIGDETAGFKLKSSVVKNYINNKINTLDEQLTSMSVSEDPNSTSRKTFVEAGKNLLTLGEIAGVKSKFIMSFEDGFQTRLANYSSLSEARKALEMGNMINDYSGTFYNKLSNKAMLASMSKILDNTDMPEDKRLNEFNLARLDYVEKNSYKLFGGEKNTQKFMDSFNSEIEVMQGKFLDTRLPIEGARWALFKSKLDPNTIDQDTFNKAVLDNMFVYGRQSSEGGLSRAYGIVGVTKSIFSSRNDNIMLPNSVGKSKIVTNDKNVISDAVTMALRERKLDMEDIKISYYEDSFSIYTHDGDFVANINSNNAPELAARFKEQDTTKNYKITPVGNDVAF